MNWRRWGSSANSGQNYIPSAEALLAISNASAEGYRTEQAVLRERERCALVAEGFGWEPSSIADGELIAAKIRSGE